MITAKRDFLKFYLAILGFVSFYLIMASIVFGLLTIIPVTIGWAVMLLMGLGCVFMAIYNAYIYFRNAPIIKVDEQSIVFNSETYFWKDLVSIEMTGKKHFKFFDSRNREATTMIFKGEVVKTLFDDMYDNAPDIKTFIQKHIFAKALTESNITSKASVSDVDFRHFDYYKGFQLLCIEGIMLWLFLLPALLLSVWTSVQSKLGGSLGFGIFGIIWFFLWGRRLHYFGVAEHHLIIKEHNQPWFHKTYQLADIREVVFEIPFKMPVCLRVITNSFENTLYPAGTLWSKTWIQLKENLEKKGIRVRNEGVSYEPFEFKFQLVPVITDLN